jgi:hypothetical protein
LRTSNRPDGPAFCMAVGATVWLKSFSNVTVDVLGL